MTPTIGRVVHYVARGSLDGKFPPTCRAALITEVGEGERGLVGLAAINPTGFFFHSIAEGGSLHDDGEAAPLDESACAERHYPGGTWHWPPRLAE